MAPLRQSYLPMSQHSLAEHSNLTRSLVSIWALFLCWILMMPGGWIQASPSTCTGTPSSPRMVIFTMRHCGADSPGLASIATKLSRAALPQAPLLPQKLSGTTWGPAGCLLPTTCAMRWCWRLMTRDTAIWMLPKTATTSSFLSSKDGAPKFCRGPLHMRPPKWAHSGTPMCLQGRDTPALGFLRTGARTLRHLTHLMVLALTLSSFVPPQKLMPPA